MSRVLFCRRGRTEPLYRQTLRYRGAVIASYDAEMASSKWPSSSALERTVADIAHRDSAVIEAATARCVRFDRYVARLTLQRPVVGVSDVA